MTSPQPHAMIAPQMQPILSRTNRTVAKPSEQTVSPLARVARTTESSLGPSQRRTEHLRRVDRIRLPYHHNLDKSPRLSWDYPSPILIRRPLGSGQPGHMTFPHGEMDYYSSKSCPLTTHPNRDIALSTHTSWTWVVRVSHQLTGTEIGLKRVPNSLNYYDQRVARPEDWIRVTRLPVLFKPPVAGVSQPTSERATLANRKQNQP